MKKHKYLLLALGILSGVISSCNLVDFSQLDVTTFPAGRDLVVSGTVTEVWLQFNQKTDKDSVEQAVSLSTEAGHVVYDTAWDDNRLILKPLEPWKAGIRYTLSAKGTVSGSGSRSFLVDVQSTFYIDTDTNPPVLLGITPLEDDIVSQNQPVTFTFSQPVTAQELDRHILIAPAHDITITTSNNGRTVTIQPDKNWTGLTRYQWTIVDTLPGESGVAVLEKYTGTFRTLADLNAPEQPEIYAYNMNLEDGQLHPVDVLAKGYGVVFSFDEGVVFDSFKKKIAIEPETSLNYRQLNQSTFLVFPQDTIWLPEQEYTLTIAEGLEDLSGNKTAESFVFSVSPNIPELSVISVYNYPESPTGPTSFTGEDMMIKNNVHIINNDTPPGTSHTFTITLSEPLNRTEAQRFVSALSFEPFFPHYLPRPELATVLFNPSANPREIRVKYIWHTSFSNTGLEEERMYYLFSIKSGKTGFITDSGSFFPEDLSIYLELLHED